MLLNKTLLNVSSNQKITSWKYSINGGENKTPTSNQILVNDGENNLIVYGTNSNGTGSSSISFNAVLFNPAHLPKITIKSPIQGFTYTSSSPLIKTESNQSIILWKYSINGGESKNCIFCETGDILEALEGRNNLIVYGTNSNGTGSSSLYFFVNTTSV